jgi:ketosteroid isomerase-like protein
MFLRSTISCFLVVGAIFTGVAGSPALAQDDATATCKAAIRAYEAAVASGAPAKVVARFANDGTLATPFGIFKGRQAITQFYSEPIKPGAKDSDTLTTVQQVGGVVLCSGAYAFTLAPGGPVKESRGYYTKTLTKSGDEWLLVNLTWNFAAPPMPPKKTH